MVIFQRLLLSMLCLFGLASVAQAGVVPAPGDIIFNEYVADNNASGNDYFELLVLTNNLDLRGLRVSDNELVAGALNNGETVFIFGNNSFLNNVPAGTIIAVYTIVTGVTIDSTTSAAASDWSMTLAPGSGVTTSADGLGGTTNPGLANGGEALYLYLPGADGTSAGTDNIYLDFMSYEGDGGDAPTGFTDINLPSVADNAYYTGNTAAGNDLSANWTTYDFTGTSSPNTTPGLPNIGQNLSTLQVVPPPSVTLSVSANTGTEAGTTVITVTATASSAVASNQTVNVAVTGTNITAGDYTLSNTTITIASGATTGTVTFTVVDDALVEGTETATLTIISPSVGILLGTTTTQNIAITDNDSPSVVLSVSANTGTEAAATVITVTATSSVAVVGDQTVNVAVTGTNITAGDYALSNATITILNGATTGSVTFTVVDDALVEGTETATLTISNPSAGITLGATTTQNIAITDNDNPTVSLSLSTNTGSEAATTSVTITATASAAVTSAQTITLTVTGTGITAIDYYLTNTTITIASGQTTGTVTLVIADDAIPESNEVLTVSINTISTGLVLGTPTTQNLSIANNTCSFMTKIGAFTSVNGAEISAHDPISNHIFTVAGTVIDEYSISNTGALTLVGALPLGFTPPAGTAGIPNSVSVKNGIVAAAYAVQNTTSLAQSNGQVTFYDATTGAVLNSVQVGYLPDMITFTPDGTKLLTANEGEPNSYGQGNSFDPEGSVSIINISAGVTNATVQTVGFTSFNSQLATLRAAGVRIYGPGATVAQDFEPEYIAFDATGQTARVVLQENNAFAVLDIASATFTSIQPLGLKNHNLPGNGFDASDRDLTSSTGKINIQNWPVYGMYQPDAIASYVVNGVTYYITANEGDTRAYTGYTEEVRVGVAAYALDPTTFSNAANLKLNANLGRLQLSNATGDTDNDGDFDMIHANGARSFSIWDGNGALVFDSGDQLEQLTATKVPTLFNSDGLAATFDTRSDNKGPEPEGVAIGTIDGQTYAFVGLERVGDIVVYNVTNPAAPVFVQYINMVEDVSPEGVAFIKASDSPTGNPLVMISCEVSKTIGIFEIGTSAQITITDNSGITPNDGIICQGASATLVARGGTTYLWSNGATTASTTVTTAGTYTVTVTNSAGCTNTAATTVQVNALPTAAITKTDVSCFGNSTGAINLNVTGGAGTYTYNWTGAVTTQNLSNLVAGTYNVTVTDAAACATTASATITQPAAALAATTASVTNVACFGNNTGAINLNVTGGTTAYTYNWTGGVSTQNRTNLAAGTYTVTVTDANACTTTVSTTITQPTAALAATTASVTNVACFGNATGAINLNVTGGTTAYTYNWTGGVTTQNRTNLTAGTYTVTVTDANACSTTASATITQPTAALAATTASVTNVACFGNATGAINLNVTGGTTAYTYNWTGGVTTQNRTNLTAGTYAVTVTDANACTATAFATITQPTAALAASTTSTTNVACFGNATGAINLNVTGGTSAYTYNWTGGSTTQNPNNLTAGTYNVTVTDANACTTTVSATITQPTASLAATTSATNVDCFGNATGAINLSITGGTSAYTYNWTGGITTQNLSNLAAGTYAVTVTDANSCLTTVSAIISEPTVLAVTPTTVSNITCFGAANGSIDLSVNGGTTPYTYLWDNSATSQDLQGLDAGTYAVTITDNNNCTVASTSLTITEPSVLQLGALPVSTPVTCNGACDGSISNVIVVGGTAPYTYLWSNNATTATLTNVCAGTYTGTITDANGCTYTPPVGLDVTEPAVLAASLTGTNCTAFGASDGSINSTVTGGTSPYTYTWTNNASGANPTQLLAGTYAVTVTDANGCTQTASVVISQPNGINGLSAINSFNLYPNPNDGNFTMSIELSKVDTIDLTIFNALGQMIYHNEMTGANSTNVLANVAEQPAGTYIVRLNVGKDTLYKQFVLVK